MVACARALRVQGSDIKGVQKGYHGSDQQCTEKMVVPLASFSQSFSVLPKCKHVTALVARHGLQKNRPMFGRRLGTWVQNALCL